MRQPPCIALICNGERVHFLHLIIFAHTYVMWKIQVASFFSPLDHCENCDNLLLYVSSAFDLHLFFFFQSQDPIE